MFCTYGDFPTFMCAYLGYGFSFRLWRHSQYRSEGGESNDLKDWTSFNGKFSVEKEKCWLRSLQYAYIFLIIKRLIKIVACVGEDISIRVCWLYLVFCFEISEWYMHKGNLLIQTDGKIPKFKLVWIHTLNSRFTFRVHRMHLICTRKRHFNSSSKIIVVSKYLI